MSNPVRLRSNRRTHAAIHATAIRSRYAPGTISLSLYFRRVSPESVLFVVRNTQAGTRGSSTPRAPRREPTGHFLKPRKRDPRNVLCAVTQRPRTRKPTDRNLVLRQVLASRCSTGFIEPFFSPPTDQDQRTHTELQPSRLSQLKDRPNWGRANSQRWYRSINTNSLKSRTSSSSPTRSF